MVRAATPHGQTAYDQVREMEKSMKEQLVAEIAGQEEYWSPDERGRDWFDLTDADIEIFQIDPARWPAMIKTFEYYEIVKDLLPSEVGEDVVEFRRQYPQWKPDRDLSVGEFQAFAAEMGTLSFREAHAVFDRQGWWVRRNICVRYRDEPI